MIKRKEMIYKKISGVLIIAVVAFLLLVVQGVAAQEIGGYADARAIGAGLSDNGVVGTVLNGLNQLIVSQLDSGTTTITTTNTSGVQPGSIGQTLWESLLPISIIICGIIIIGMNWRHPVKMVIYFVFLVMMLIIAQAFIKVI